MEYLRDQLKGLRDGTRKDIDGTMASAAQGLSDEASKNDDLITLRELSDYLTDQVSAWVARNRASVQTPRLLTPLPSERDFAVAYRGKSSGAVSARAEAADRGPGVPQSQGRARGFDRPHQRRPDLYRLAQP